MYIYKGYILFRNCYSNLALEPINNIVVEVSTSVFPIYLCVLMGLQSMYEECMVTTLYVYTWSLCLERVCISTFLASFLFL